VRSGVAISKVLAVLGPLVCGFAVSAVVVYGLASYIGEASGFAGAGVIQVVVAGVLIALAVIEVGPFRVRRSLCRRQTPKPLVGRHSPVIGGFFWGLDTGTVLSTYRVSMASWAALLICAAGWGGAWTGLFYAAGFCIPLAVVLLSCVVPWAPAWAFAQTHTDRALERILQHIPTVLRASASVTVLSAGVMVL
jgi:hypothetical protein